MNNTVLNNIAHFVGKMVIIFSSPTDATILVKYLLNVYSIQLTDFYYLKIICFLGLIISSISALDYLIKLILYSYFKTDSNVTISKNLPKKISIYLNDLKILSKLEESYPMFFFYNFVLYLIIFFILIYIFIVI